MRVTQNAYEFYEETGMITDPDRVSELGLFTDDICAAFEPEAVDALLKFCSENPNFHIVTALEDATLYVNRFEENGCLYKLAEGNADPNYMLDARPVIQNILSAFMPNAKMRT